MSLPQETPPGSNQPLFVGTKVRCQGLRCIKAVAVGPGKEPFCYLHKLANKGEKAKEVVPAHRIELQGLQYARRTQNGKKWVSNSAIRTPDVASAQQLFAIPTPIRQLPLQRYTPNTLPLPHTRSFGNIRSIGISSVDRPQFASGSGAENVPFNSNIPPLANSSRLRRSLAFQPTHNADDGDDDNDSLPDVRNLQVGPTPKPVQPRATAANSTTARPNRNSMSQIRRIAEDDDDGAILDFAEMPASTKLKQAAPLSKSDVTSRLGASLRQPGATPKSVPSRTAAANLPGSSGTRGALQNASNGRERRKTGPVRTAKNIKSKKKDKDKQYFDSDSEDDGGDLQLLQHRRDEKARNSSEESSCNGSEIADVAAKNKSNRNNTLSEPLDNGLATSQPLRRSTRERSGEKARVQPQLPDVGQKMKSKKPATMNKKNFIRDFGEPIPELKEARLEQTGNGMRYRIPGTHLDHLRDELEREKKGQDDGVASVEAGAAKSGVSHAGTLLPPAGSNAGSDKSKRTMQYDAIIGEWHQRENEQGMFIEEGDELMEEAPDMPPPPPPVEKIISKRAVSPSNVSQATAERPKKVGRFMKGLLSKKEKDDSRKEKDDSKKEKDDSKKKKDASEKEKGATKVQIEVVIPSYEPDKNLNGSRRQSSDAPDHSRNMSASASPLKRPFSGDDFGMDGASEASTDTASNKRQKVSSQEHDDMDMMDFVAQLGDASEEAQVGSKKLSAQLKAQLGNVGEETQARARKPSAEVEAQVDELYKKYNVAKENLIAHIEDSGWPEAQRKVVELARQIDALVEEHGIENKRLKLFFEF